MTCAGCIGSQQYLTWTQHKCFTVASREFECTRQSEHILHVWRGVPIEGGTSWAFLEVDRRRFLNDPKRNRDLFDM